MIDDHDLANRPVREHLVAPPENSQLRGRWVDAVDLRAGDTVFLQGPGPTPIESVRPKPVHYSVYNFAVDELKCYTVGPHSVLVHNSNGLELPGVPLGKGSTASLSKGTTLPRNLREQLAIEEVLSKPAIGKELDIIMTDTKNGWMASDGWVKMQQFIKPGGGEGPINVHYVYNKLTQQIDDLKIVLHGVR